ncbi:MAG TPA: MFS transporter [Ohtaekwangia sp.]|uniref:MFS transporter n=1 Tax=Ohtaekwangia sp. TaxID=2066019 RepID=UPI002F946593
MKKSLFALLLGGLGIGTTEFVMMGLLPDIANNLDVSIPVAGYLISAYALGVVIGAPLLVILAGGYPPKKILITLTIMFTVFNGLSSLAPGYISLFFLRLLSGLPHGAFFGVGAVVASRLADKGKEAQAVSIMFAGLTIANLMGVPLGTFLGHNYSWRYSFLLIAAIGLITLLCLQLWMPKLENNNKTNIAEQLTFFKRLDAWLIISITAIGTGGLFCWISYIAPLLTNVSGFSADQVPFILSWAGLGMLVGNLMGGWLADRYSPAKTSFALLLCMVASLILVSFFSQYKSIALITTFITGALSFSLAAPIQMLMIQTARGAEMFAAAVSQACFNIGNALGAFLGGLPLMAGYSYTSPEWVGVFMALIGAASAAMLIRGTQKSIVTQPQA